MGGSIAMMAIAMMSIVDVRESTVESTVMGIVMDIVMDTVDTRCLDLYGSCRDCFEKLIAGL